MVATNNNASNHPTLLERLLQLFKLRTAGAENQAPEHKSSTPRSIIDPDSINPEFFPWPSIFSSLTVPANLFQMAASRLTRRGKSDASRENVRNLFHDTQASQPVSSNQASYHGIVQHTKDCFKQVTEACQTFITMGTDDEVRKQAKYSPDLAAVLLLALAQLNLVGCPVQWQGQERIVHIYPNERDRLAIAWKMYAFLAHDAKSLSPEMQALVRVLFEAFNLNMMARNGTNAILWNNEWMTRHRAFIETCLREYQHGDGEGVPYSYSNSRKSGMEPTAYRDFILKIPGTYKEAQTALLESCKHSDLQKLGENIDNGSTDALSVLATLFNPTAVFQGKGPNLVDSQIQDGLRQPWDTLCADLAAVQMTLSKALGIYDPQVTVGNKNFTEPSLDDAASVSHKTYTPASEDEAVAKTVEATENIFFRSPPASLGDMSQVNMKRVSFAPHM